METGKMKLALSAGALALSMALAGCGGGGSNSQTRAEGPATPTSPNENPTPDPTTYAVLGVPGADARPSNWSVGSGRTEIEAGETAMRGSLDITCPLGDVDCVITVENGSLRSSVSGTSAELTEAAKAQLASDNNQKQQDAKTTTARAEGVLEALEDPLPVAVVSPVTVAWTDGAPEFKSTNRQESDTGPTPVGSDWYGAIFTASNSPSGAVPNTDKIVVYSDLDEPTKADFNDVYGNTPKYRQNSRSNYDAVSGIAAVITDGKATGATIGPTLAHANRGLLDGTHFPKRDRDRDVTWIYGGNTPTNDHTSEQSFDAKFHGADGTYVCSGGGACTVTVASSDGEYTFAGTWTFTPKSGAKVVLSDVDHLQFGYWIQRPDRANDTGDYDYVVQLIAGGSQAYLFDDGTYGISPVAGGARYEGAAAGVFATKTVTDGNLESASYGEFTATAELRADFGTAAAGTPGNLQGSIKNFVSDSSVDMTDWSVSLQQTAITGTGTPPMVAVIAQGSPAAAFMGDDEAETATWGAAFFGGGYNDAAPTGVTGSFHADFENGARIAGAFGARQMKP